MRRFANRTDECRRITQYQPDSLRFMLKVGTLPSAGGARPPLAGIVSHLTTTVGFWVVNFWRNRCFFLYQYKEAELFLEVVKRYALGLRISWDSTPMRTWVNGEDLRRHEVILTSIRAFGGDGVCRRKVAHRMVLPANRKTSGILGSVTHGNLYSEGLFSDNADVNYVILLGGSCATNKTSMKATIAQIIGHNGKSIVVPSFCSPHRLNNRTIWSLAIVMFGEILRTAH